MSWLQRPAVLALVGALIVLTAVSWRQWMAVKVLPNGLPDYQASFAQEEPPSISTVMVESGFDPFRSAETRVASSPRPAPRRQPHNLVLEGVLHLPGQGGGAAILRQGDKVRAARAGARIDKRIELVEIHADHVVLDNDGQREVVSLRRPEVAQAGSVVNRRQRRFARNHQQAPHFD